MGSMTTAEGQREAWRRKCVVGRHVSRWMSLCLALSLANASLFWLTSGRVSAAELLDPTRYIVGPGDEFTVSFSEASIEPLTTVVGIEGAASIDGVGTFFLAGLALSEAKAKLLLGLSKRFAGSGPELRLTNVRTKRTLVAGAVKSPGLYETKAIALVSDLIAKAGGLVVGASRRNIEIHAEEGNFSEKYAVDLEMFSLVGDPESNPAVYLGDVIYVPLFTDSTQRLYVSGEVRSPRWIEYTGRDDVMGLIQLSGGLTGSARKDSALLYESSPNNVAQRSMISLTVKRTLSPGSRVIALSSGVKVIEKDISISGAVKNPGRYPFVSGLTIESLIATAGGVTSEAYEAGVTLFNSSFDHGPLARSLAGAENDAVGKANFFAPAGPPSAGNVRSGGVAILAPGDSVVVPFAEGFVSVLGQVKVPGLVRFDSGRSVFDYIGLAGGTHSWADIKHSYVTRKLARGATPLTSTDRIYDGDIIFVAKKHGTSGSGTLSWLRDITLIGAGVALTVFAIDRVGN